MPGDAETNDVDTTDIDQAGVGDDAGFDDEDIASVTTTVVYDLSLVKRLPDGQRFHLGDVVRYEIEVTNQGNVPSGAYSVNDTLPTGLEFASASSGGTAAGQTVTWTDLPSLAPGAGATLTVEAHLTDVDQSSYLNTAQISDDSAEQYSTATETVTDRDSTPGQVLDEDDEGRAEIPLAAVRADNATPDRGGLAFTGTATFKGLLAAGICALLAGLALLVLQRRRRLAHHTSRP